MKKLLVMSSLMFLPLWSWAWGPEGHAAVGAIADANLSTGAKVKVAVLLQGDLNAQGKPSGRKTLASVASWADEIKSTPEGKADGAWHYHDNPVCGTTEGVCSNGACVDKKITEQVAVLKSPGASNLQKNQALKWIVHLVGDIHQPLHVGENGDKGGNDVPVALQGVKTKGRANLHKVWDSDLVRLVLADQQVAGKTPAGFQAGMPEQWMQEGREYAKTTAYGYLPGFACGQKSPDKIVVLSTAYQAAAKEVIRKQLLVGGQRLTAVLEDALQ